MAYQIPNQKRYVDPYSSYFSSNVDRLTSIVAPNGRLIVKGLEVSMVDASNFQVTSGLAIQSYVVIECPDNMTINLSDTQAVSGQDNLIVLVYQYQQSYPPPVASIDVIDPGVYNPNTHLILGIVTLDSSGNITSVSDSNGTWSRDDSSDSTWVVNTINESADFLSSVNDDTAQGEITFEQDINVKGDINVGNGVENDDKYINVVGGRRASAILNLMGTYDTNSAYWGLGKIFLGAHPGMGGGIVFNGVNNGDDVGDDYNIVFYRRDGTGEYEVFDYSYNEDNVHFYGDITVDGVINGTATQARYADLAEKYTVKDNVEVGDVILVSEDGDFDCEKSNDFNSYRVLGVVSENPSYLMNATLESGIPVALKGRVKCKVKGKVKKGDPLISYYDGAAISIFEAKLTPYNSNIFAKALETKDIEEEQLIEVIVL